MKVIGTYSFLPFLRQGVANIITAADGDTTVKSRASVNVSVTLTGQPVTSGAAPLTQTLSQQVSLYGPGDIGALLPSEIIRTEPVNFNTNFESNYLPCVDLYDVDAPWRHTPAAPNDLRLRPWITLVVLADNEFTEDKGSTPLPFINVPDVMVFPPADDLWAWAHVHFNQNLSGHPTKMVEPDMSTVLPLMQSLLGQSSDAAYSRLLSPRRLAPSTSYHAFIMPTFETGRLTGLFNPSPETSPYATFSAWANYAGKPKGNSYPYYYRWYFRTGDVGDFEYLVKLLQPRPIDPRVGVRDMDVQDPGSNIPGITLPVLKGILPLGGALQVPEQDLDPASMALRNTYNNWDQPYPQPFQTSLAKFINLADDYATLPPATANAATDISAIASYPDPLITAPLYGCWHALIKRLLYNRDGTPAVNSDNWVHNLNLDPQFRVPANFGNEVIEANTEEYMNDAWQQVGAVLAANAWIRRLKLSMEVSMRWYQRTLQPLAAHNFERALALTAPFSSRILLSGKTIAYTRNASLVPLVYTSAAMRRVTRPAGRLMRLLPFNATITPNNLLSRVNSGQVTAAPPKVVPPGVATVDQVAAASVPATAPAWIISLLQKYPWLANGVLIAAIVLGILLVLILGLPGIPIALAIIGAAIYLRNLLNTWKAADDQQSMISESNQTPAAVDQLPKNPAFVLSTPAAITATPVGTTDSPTALRFKAALRDSFSLITTTAAVSQRPMPVAIDLAQLNTTILKAIDPTVTIPKRASSLVSIPDWIRQLIGPDFAEVMAYPTIDLPMYMPLKAISTELLLPNINLIPNNSITLIETNQKFIEGYMVGLNHSFARKLLWREYPTDQRGSYFRQFWDPRSDLNTGRLTTDELKESQYDITKLHQWPSDSTLGTHNNRVPVPAGAEQAVLVIRGELLKKYPTAVVYAHHAQWSTDKNGTVDTKLARDLEDIDDAFQDNPPSNIIRMPIYEAKVDPDIYFFGFDLTVAQAKGGTNATDDPGWFFVLKQRPGEPRFGLEISRDSALEVTDELAWNDALPGATAGQFLPAGALSVIALTAPPVPSAANGEDPDEYVNKTAQHGEDKQAAIADSSSARWAYLLFRSPVMVAVHAADMLRRFT